MIPRTLAILRFRSIATPAPEDWLTSRAVPEERFDEALGWLLRKDWRPLSVRLLVKGLQAHETLPERSFLLTFDGGCRTILTHGLPILRRYRFPAAVFISTDFVGREATFEGHEEPVTVCTWDELMLLDRNDIAVQSQGVGRRRFARLDALQQEQEATESKKAIESRMRRRVDLFAYPQGNARVDPVAAKMLRLAGYRAALALGETVNTIPGADPFRLARISMGPESDIEAVLES